MFVDEKAAGEAQTAEQKNRTLKLSEAMRLGAALRQQCTGIYSQGRNATCAIGAAVDGLGGDARNFWGDTKRAWEFVLNRTGIKDEKSTLCVQVLSKNDNAHWTREQIADWLEGQGY